MKCLFFILPIVALLPMGQAAEHLIHIQNEAVAIRCPATWVIIAHRPAGSASDVVAFQVLNPADLGSEDSTNVAVTAFDVRDTEAMLKFTQGILEHGKEKHTESEAGEWAIYSWSAKQGETEYEIRDCYRTAGNFGLHARLAFPKLKATTKEWANKLEADFKKVLETLSVKEVK